MEINLKPLDIEYQPIECHAPHAIEWKNFCEAENALAMRLYGHELFQHMLTNGPNAWLLRQRGESWVLCHADWDGEHLSNVESRHDVGLDWLDNDENDIIGATEMLHEMQSTFWSHLSKVSHDMELHLEKEAQA